MFPHRERLKQTLRENIEGARSQMQDADDYSRKQLQRYVDGMQQSLALIESMKEEYEPDTHDC